MTDTRNCKITEAVGGWNPPDTDELANIVNLLNKIGNRIHSLRIAYLINNGIENGRIRRIMAGRKNAIEKAVKGASRLRRKTTWRRRRK